MELGNRRGIKYPPGLDWKKPSLSINFVFLSLERNGWYLLIIPQRIPPTMNSFHSNDKWFHQHIDNLSRSTRRPSIPIYIVKVVVYLVSSRGTISGRTNYHSISNCESISIEG